MENKYEKFIQSMEKLKSDRNKQECKILISLAKDYYSYYCQYQKLASVENKMEHIYKLPTKSENGNEEKIILKQGELDIRYRLFVEFYLNHAYDEKLNSKNNFLWVKDYKSVLEDIEEELEVSRYKIGNYHLNEWIEKSCSKALKTYRKKQKIELGLKNIREAVRRYNRYADIKIKTEEESFNNMFSEKFVDTLISVMNTEEGILSLHTAPIRAQLCKPEQGGREIDNKAWKWCYAKDFRLSITELEEEIKRLKKYSSIFKDFCNISKELHQIEKCIQKKNL